MKELHISEEMLSDLGISFRELLVILFYATEDEQSFDECCDALHKRNVLMRTLDGYVPTYWTFQEMLSAINKFDKWEPSDDSSVTELAKRMKEAYDAVPTVTMQNYCCEADAKRALKRFFRVYGNYDAEIIMEALNEYLSKFYEDGKYLKNLRNFIIKIDFNGDISSTLASYIELIEERNDKTGEKRSIAEDSVC